MEILVARQLQVHLELFSLLDQNQSGLRPRHGTETALSSVWENIQQNADSGSLTLLVLFDLSSAFDTVDHNLLDRLSSEAGAVPQTVAWFRSFLSGRQQRIQLGTIETPWEYVPCGVPQGSPLIPGSL